MHASKLYEKIEQYLTISQHTNNVELIIAGYKSLYDFVKTLNFSDFIMRIYSIYAQKFQEHAQQFIQTRGISGETGIFEGISLVLRAISVKMILKVENEVFIDIIEIIFQTLEVSLEPYLINLLAQLVACLGPASSNYDEKICQIYNSCMETNNLLIICSCCNLISITFEEANQQTNYLRTVAINIWDSLYSFFTSNYPGDLETDYFNLILHGLTSMISFLPPQYFVEKRDNFFNSLDSITRNIPRFKKIDFGDDDYLVTLALLFQGYGKVIEMYREDEHSLIMDRNRQNESFLYANRQRYTTLFKIADENFDYNSSKNADNMVAAFLIFLDVLIKGIGQSISLELNAKWVRKLFDFASSSTNRFINNQAYHMRERYLNL